MFQLFAEIMPLFEWMKVFLLGAIEVFQPFVTSQHYEVVIIFFLQIF